MYSRVCRHIYMGIKVFISCIYVYMQVDIHTVTGRAATGQGSTVALLAWVLVGPPEVHLLPRSSGAGHPGVEALIA